MRRDGLLKLKVWLADPRGVIIAFVERGRTTEEDSQDGVPGEQAVIYAKLAPA
jgi:hypothetical protein